MVQGGGNACGDIVFLKPLATTIGQLIYIQIVNSVQEPRGRFGRMDSLPGTTAPPRPDDATLEAAVGLLGVQIVGPPPE